MIIDDEEHIRSALACFLEDFEDFHVRSAQIGRASCRERV